MTFSIDPFKRRFNRAHVVHGTPLTTERIKALNKKNPEFLQRLGTGDVREIEESGRASFDNYSLAFMLGVTAFHELTRNVRGGGFLASAVIEAANAALRRDMKRLFEEELSEQTLLAIARFSDMRDGQKAYSTILRGTPGELLGRIADECRGIKEDVSKAKSFLIRNESTTGSVDETDLTLARASVTIEFHRFTSMQLVNLSEIFQGIISNLTEMSVERLR